MCYSFSKFMLRCISIPNIAEISKGQLLVVKWLKKNCCHENIQLCYSFPKIWTRMHGCLASDVIEGKGCVFGHESYLIVIRNCGVRMLRWGWCWVLRRAEDGPRVQGWKAPLFLQLVGIANRGRGTSPLSLGLSSQNPLGEGCWWLSPVPSVASEPHGLLIPMLTLMALFLCR